MTWEEYCKKKKIDSDKFRAAEPERWKEWKDLFEQIHPNSFTEQKKFLINDTRKKYHLKEEEIKEPVKQASESQKEPTIEIPKSTSPVIAKKPGGVKIPPRKPSPND